jgi:hypothetical protein
MQIQLHNNIKVISKITDIEINTIKMSPESKTTMMLLTTVSLS